MSTEMNTGDYGDLDCVEDVHVKTENDWMDMSASSSESENEENAEDSSESDFDSECEDDVAADFLKSLSFLTEDKDAANNNTRDSKPGAIKIKLEVIPSTIKSEPLASNENCDDDKSIARDSRRNTDTDTFESERKEYILPIDDPLNQDDVKPKTTTAMPSGPIRTSNNIDFKEIFPSLVIHQISQEKHIIKNVALAQLPKNDHCCKVCQRRFGTSFLLHYHNQNVHETKNNYSCTLCKEKFSVLWFLQNHSKVAHSGTLIRFCCQLCQQNFFCKTDLDEHKRKGHDIRQHPYNCKHCEESYKTMPHLRCHLKNNHKGTSEATSAATNQYRLEQNDDNDTMSIICNQCDEEFKRTTELIKHTSSEHKGIFHCSCKRTFKAHYRWKVHQKMHLAGVQQFSCEICTTTYGNWERLCKHYSTHLSNFESELHVCYVCNQSYRTGDALKRHRNYAHEKPKRHKCDECDKAYVYFDQLRTHQRNSHKKEVSSKYNKYSCGICNKKFSKHGLTVHKIRIHGDNDKQKLNATTNMTNIEGLIKSSDSYQIDLMKCFNPETSLFTCPVPVCGRSCTRKNHFRRHMRTLHQILSYRNPDSDITGTIEAKHKCEKCEKTFTRKDLLLTHDRLRHTGIQNHVSGSFNSIKTPFLECGWCQKQVPFGGIIAHVDRHKRTVVHQSQARNPKKGKDLNEFYNDETKLFDCDMCNETSVNSASLEIHLKIHHYVIKYDKNKDVRGWFQFDCPHCSSKHPTLWHLRQHVVRHESIRKRKNAKGEIVEYRYK